MQLRVGMEASGQAAGSRGFRKSWSGEFIGDAAQIRANRLR
jgi:hypothetical protein